MKPASRTRNRARETVLALLAVLACACRSTPEPPPELAQPPADTDEESGTEGVGGDETGTGEPGAVGPPPADEASDTEEPQDVPTVPAVPEEFTVAEKPPGWHPPAPDPTDKDWIKLKSGEWLRGELKYLRDDELEFESDELDTLVLDWGDVHELRSPRVEDVVFEGRSIVVGTIAIDRENVTIRTEEGEEEVYPRSEIVSIVPDARSQWDLWSGDLSLGLSTQTGNTTQSSLNSQAKIRRRSPLSRVGLDWVSNVGSVDGTTNVNNHRFTGSWNLFLSKRFFVTPAQFTWFRDPIANIANQAVPSAGGGYHLVRNPSAEWSALLNLGAQWTEFDSVAAGDDETDFSFALIPGTEVDWDITKNIEWTFSYTLQLPFPDTESNVSHLLTSLSFDILKNIDLDLSFQWDRVANPQEGADGETPDSDDYRFVLGIGWEF